MIYNPTVPQKDRAKILFLSSDEPKADMPSIAKSTDAVVIRMGGMDGSTKEMNTMLYWEKDAFQIRCDQAKAVGLPIFAQFILRAGYHLDKQHAFITIEKETWDQNELILGIINALRTKAWTPSTLKLDADWKTIHGIILNTYDLNDKNGNQIGDAWQALTVDNVYKNIIMLQETGRFPKVPIIIQSWGGFLKSYPAELLNYLYNRRKDISVGLTQPVYDTIAGPQLTSLQVLWDTYRPSDAFKFSNIPYGYESGNAEGNVVFHNFTYSRFSVPELFDAAGNHKPANCALWCDTKIELYKFLNFVPSVIIPPVDPPIDPPPVDPLVTNLTELTKRVDAIEEFLSTFPTFKKL
jgi:hypothetical protein